MKLIIEYIEDKKDIDAQEILKDMLESIAENLRRNIMVDMGTHSIKSVEITQ